jgi:hypothetical protein
MRSYPLSGAEGDNLDSHLHNIEIDPIPTSLPAGTGLGTTEDIEAYYAGQRSVALIPRVKSPFEFAGINYI